MQPDTIHVDTQGQSTAIFGLAHLLCIQLMPRIRNWKELHLFRPSAEWHYVHIDSLFGLTTPYPGTKIEINSRL
jgi:TnpA family transposase